MSEKAINTVNVIIALMPGPLAPSEILRGLGYGNEASADDLATLADVIREGEEEGEEECFATDEETGRVFLLQSSEMACAVRSQIVCQLIQWTNNATVFVRGFIPEFGSWGRIRN